MRKSPNLFYANRMPCTNELEAPIGQNLWTHDYTRE